MKMKISVNSSYICYKKIFSLFSNLVKTPYPIISHATYINVEINDFTFVQTPTTYLKKMLNQLEVRMVFYKQTLFTEQNFSTEIDDSLRALV